MQRLLACRAALATSCRLPQQQQGRLRSSSRNDKKAAKPAKLTEKLHKAKAQKSMVLGSEEDLVSGAPELFVATTNESGKAARAKVIRANEKEREKSKKKKKKPQSHGSGSKDQKELSESVEEKEGVDKEEAVGKAKGEQPEATGRNLSAFLLAYNKALDNEKRSRKDGEQPEATPGAEQQPAGKEETQKAEDVAEKPGAAKEEAVKEEAEIKESAAAEADVFESKVKESAEAEADVFKGKAEAMIKRLVEKYNIDVSILDTHPTPENYEEKMKALLSKLAAKYPEVKKLVEENAASAPTSSASKPSPPSATHDKNTLPPPPPPPSPSPPSSGSALASAFVQSKSDLEAKVAALQEKLRLLLSKPAPTAGVPLPTALHYEVLRSEGEDCELKQPEDMEELPTEYFGSINRVDVAGVAGRPSTKLWQTGIVTELSITTTFTRCELNGGGVLSERELHRVYIHGETLANYVMRNVKQGFLVHVQGRLSAFPRWSEEEGKLITSHAINVHPECGGTVTVMRGSSKHSDSVYNDLEFQQLSAKAAEDASKLQKAPENETKAGSA